MSQENVEVVRQVYDAVSRRDDTTVFTLYDPDIEWDDSRITDSVVRGRIRGHDALRAWIREFYGSWAELSFQPDELIDAGNDVVAVVTARGRGRASGLTVEETRVLVFTVEAGKIIRVVWFPTKSEALEAAGLSE
jgi:ketosteroid isomerase-like protein